MNALVHKEIRSLLPVWIAALLVSTLPALVWTGFRHEMGMSVEAVLFAPFGLGILMLALSSFGQEFGSGTFSILLAQPVPRIRIWRTKVVLLAISLIAVAAVFLLGVWLVSGSYDTGFVPYSGLVCLLMVAAAFTGGLWTTLLLRQVAAAFWFALLAPAFISVLTGAFLPEQFQFLGMSIALALYSVLGFVWARWMFMRAQDVQWTGGTIPLPAWRGAKSVLQSTARSPGRTPLRALAWKEIQFNHVSLLIAGVVFVLHLMMVALRKLNPDLLNPQRALSVVLGFWFLLWFTLPFLLGSLAVAEERKLGTLESHLCLPVNRRTQFAVKFAVAVILSVLLCALVPWLIEGLGVILGVRAGVFDTAFALKDLAILSAISAGIAALSFYASTLTRNTLQAMGTAVVVNALAGNVLMYTFLPKPFFIGVRLGSGPLFGCIGGPLLAATLLWLALGNYRRVLVDSKAWRHNVLVLLAVVFFALTATSLVYNRSWESFINLEPPHGPARLSGPVKPKICLAGERVFALLPDGRLWMSKKSERRFLYKYIELSRTNDTYARVPLDGEFVGTSNWVALANSYYPVVGIQSDGSLWQFTLSNRTNRQALPKLERIGTDSDWKSIAAGSEFSLALKTNGTLWGWGWNGNGELGVGPKEFTNGPVRIGTGSDWSAVFAARQASIGVKSDGSVWKWGGFYFGPDGTFYGQGNQIHPEPVRWNFVGSDWLERTGDQDMDLVIRRDGSLWATGRLPKNLLGENLYWLMTTNWIRIGHGSDWASVTFTANRAVALKKSGGFLESDANENTVFGNGDLRNPSKNKDWIAATEAWESLALAADGTLSCWIRLPEETAEGRQLLGPTRRPFWSLNIFAATK
jgi:ABC-type transport system involved in multi-copper enzyme maturation permease subunit